MAHNPSFSAEQQAFIREVARTCIEESMQNGVAAIAREQAGRVAATVAKEKIELATWKLVAIVAIGGSGAGGLSAGLISHFFK